VFCGVDFRLSLFVGLGMYVLIIMIVLLVMGVV